MGARPGVNVVKSRAPKPAPAPTKPAAAKPAVTAKPPAPKIQPVIALPKPAVTAAKPAAAPVVATTKNPAVFPTAVGGAMQGKVLAAPGNAQNKVVLDAWKASGGTTTSTYVDKYTNLAARGETALQEAARTQAAGTIAIFDKVAAAAGKPSMTVTNITGKNTETAKQALVKQPPKPAPVLNKAVVSGQNKTATATATAQTLLTPAANVANIGNFFSSNPFQLINPAIIQTPEQKKQLESMPAIVKDPAAYIQDQINIQAAKDKAEWEAIRAKQDARTAQFQEQPDTSWLSKIKIPSFSDLFGGLGGSTTPKKETTSAISTPILLMGAALAYLALRKK